MQKNNVPVAAVIDSKFNRHMPLYRQEAMFAEANIPVTRGTLSNWLIHSANLLTPLVKLMEADIYAYDIAFADETSLQVLKEKDRLPTQKSYMWLFIGGQPSKRAFVYQYHPTPSHKIPYEFFADFNGYLHADCYQAYIALVQGESMVHAACFAHARPYFVDGVKAKKKEGLAHQIVELMDKLYKIETCKQNRLEVFSWLKYVLSNIHQAHTMELLEQLLPYNINRALLNDMRSIPDLIFPQKCGVY